MAAPPATAPLRQPLSIDDWFYWWQLNSVHYETVRFRMHYMTEGPGPFLGLDVVEEDSTRWSRAPVADRVLPALLRMLDARPEEAPHVVASALIALGKLAESEKHAEVLRRFLTSEPAQPVEVREAAALGLGLLRRELEHRRLATAVLDRVRASLFACLDEVQGASRVRVAAAVALGLLGDQPTEEGIVERGRHVARLLDAALRPDLTGEVHAALLRAVGHQPRESVSASQRTVLRVCVQKGEFGDQHLNDIGRAGAAFAIGRVGGAEDIDVLTGALLARRGIGHPPQRSIAMALGRLADRVGPQDRRRIEAALIRSFDGRKDAATHNLAVLSLARVLVADARSEDWGGPDSGPVADLLLTLACKGNTLRRGFALLALGGVLHAVPDYACDAYHEWRAEALRMLRELSKDAHAERRLRVAAVTALGWARDSRSRERLLAIFEDEQTDEATRCAAARAYGCIYVDASGRGLKSFRRALASGESRAIRHAAMRGHALLAHTRLATEERDAVDLVLGALAAADTEAKRIEAILLLAHDADHRALEPLVVLLEDRKQSDGTRALAAAALGCVGDPEWMPSLDLMRTNVSFRSVGHLTWHICRLH